jgi:hypothetical protein
LSGAVVGDIPAALYFVHLYALCLQEGPGQKEVFGVGVASQGDDRGMFTEDEPVRPALGGCEGFLDIGLLPIPGLPVRDTCPVF